MVLERKGEKSLEAKAQERSIISETSFTRNATPDLPYLGSSEPEAENVLYL